MLHRISCARTEVIAIRDNETTLPEFLAVRAKGGDLATFNIEMGLITKQTFNPNSPSTATGGGGGAVGGPGVLYDITGTGGSGGGGGGGGCFLGHTEVSLWDWRIRFIELYERKQQEPDALFETLSFTDTAEKIRGQVLEVFRYTRNDYLHVTFADHSADDVAPQHRYWTGEMYAPISTLMGEYVVTEDGASLRVIGIDEVQCKKGIFVFNLAINGQPNYCANGRRVHNRKVEPEP